MLIIAWKHPGFLPWCDVCTSEDCGFGAPPSAAALRPQAESRWDEVFMINRFSVQSRDINPPHLVSLLERTAGLGWLSSFKMYNDITCLLQDWYQFYFIVHFGNRGAWRCMSRCYSFHCNNQGLEKSVYMLLNVHDASVSIHIPTWSTANVTNILQTDIKRSLTLH